MSKALKRNEAYRHHTYLIVVPCRGQGAVGIYCGWRSGDARQQRWGSTQRPVPQSLFSDELVSDKSLDEVILSYLAEDLEPFRRK